jgi:hypothetical protein
MRVVREIPHADCRITIFSWNNRYIIKLEQGLLEQTFKVAEYDVASEDELIKLLDETFIHQALERFGSMKTSLLEAIKRA